MAHGAWKVGELARRSGISVRTLHHWDEIGLLVPAERGAGGHRLYTGRDVARLERILALRSLGLALDEIAAELAKPAFSARVLLAERIERVRAAVAREERLVERLERLDARLAATRDASMEDLLETIEVLDMFEKYYTPEQLERLKRRAEELGPATMQAVQAEWPELIAAVRGEMERGTDPADARVQALAKRWDELVRMFTGGEPDIERSLARLCRGEPSVAERNGLDTSLAGYVERARAARGA